MRVIVDFETTQVINRKDTAQTIRLRSLDPIFVNGDAVEPNESGHSDLDLTASQTAVFRALLGDAEALTEAATRGYIEFPDGASKGKPLATGPSLASFLPTPEAEETPKGKGK